MTSKGKITGRAYSMPAGIALGTALCLLVTIVGAGFVAWLIAGERMNETGIGYGSMGILLASSVVGSMASAMLIKHRRLMVCMVTGLCYFALLIILNELLFGSQFEGVVVTALLVLAGSGSAALLGLRQGRPGRNRRHKTRTG